MRERCELTEIHLQEWGYVADLTQVIRMAQKAPQVGEDARGLAVRTREPIDARGVRAFAPLVSQQQSAFRETSIRNYPSMRNLEAALSRGRGVLTDF